MMEYECQCGEKLMKVGLISADISASYLFQCPNCKLVYIIYA